MKIKQLVFCCSCSEYIGRTETLGTTLKIECAKCEKRQSTREEVLDFLSVREKKEEEQEDEG